jgi:crotonobetainyl-CoA:carnitine CoA-transferase CaiB-like acyl-CoA transferase
MPPPAVSPLENVKVLDVGTYLAGPLACTHLANLGAEVVAVRRSDLSAPKAAREAAYKPAMRDALLERKRVVHLDFEHDRTAMLELIRSAHVFVTNFSATTLAKHGLDAASCAAVNPRLVHVSMPGFASADESATSPTAWESIIMASAGVFKDMGVNRQLLYAGPPRERPSCVWTS